MVNKYEWRDDYNIGVNSIDREHKQLFAIISKLYALEKEGRDSSWTCKEGLTFFRSHATAHFENEEKYMASIHYERLEQHRKIHQGFREDTLPALEKELERCNYSDKAVEHFLGVCIGWLISHTLTEDIAITGKHNNHRWEQLFSDDIQGNIKNVITQLLFDMFHLEAHLISDTYGGEMFGDGIYCRYIFGIPDKKEKVEIFMVFDEQLAVNTIGKILGLSTNKLETMLFHATRYFGRQLITQAMGCFPDFEDYQLEEESLLTYLDFHTLMKKGEQQISFLFDTGAGYFSYCVIAPHLLETGIGICIVKDNATAGVEEYLNQRSKEKEQEKKLNRRKILIVDDSATMREGMRQLLSEDYDVYTVDSGVAAIRSITLNTPDLVLLDYEMPICDGRQTLEMLRSEETFNSVPVIFLTGRKDTKSVVSVMHLKPAGYLLKTADLQHIKKEVDMFFRQKDKK